jgi:hypothetical protein
VGHGTHRSQVGGRAARLHEFAEAWAIRANDHTANIQEAWHTERTHIVNSLAVDERSNAQCGGGFPLCDANPKGEVALKCRASPHSAFYSSKRKIEANWLMDDRQDGKLLQTKPTFDSLHLR